MSDNLSNLYNEKETWEKPEAKCPHGKQFYCQICYDSWPDNIKKMREGISA